MNNSFKLSKQLMWLITLSFVIVIISLGVALPRVITPVAEANLYNYLSEPLKFINNNVDQTLINTEIAYISISQKEISKESFGQSTYCFIHEELLTLIIIMAGLVLDISFH